MAEYWAQLKNILYYMRLEDKYWGLFFAAVFVLLYMRARETRGLLLLTGITAFVCVCPLTVYGLVKLFPSLAGYYPLWHIVPAGVVICSVLALLYERVGESKRRKTVFVLGVFAILFFAGEFAYTSADAWNDDATFLGREEAAVYELLLEDAHQRGCESVTLWGPYRLMADSRVYSHAFRPIYGKDIVDADAAYTELTRNLYHGYERIVPEELSEQEWEERLAEIAGSAREFPEAAAAYIVIVDPGSLGAEVDTASIFEEWGYAYAGGTGTYQIFRRL